MTNNRSRPMSKLALALALAVLAGPAVAKEIPIGPHVIRDGLDVGAIYHSHTRTAPEPSQTDVNHAAAWPGALWIIVGLAGEEPEVRTWAIEDGRVAPVELTVE